MVVSRGSPSVTHQPGGVWQHVWLHEHRYLHNVCNLIGSDIGASVRVDGPDNVHVSMGGDRMTIAMLLYDASVCMSY